jgi:hypothetical protein
VNVRFQALLSTLLLALTVTSAAQAPAGAPAGSTAVCTDGTYSSAASKRGACSGHKGVQTWFGTTATVTPPPAAAAPAAAPTRSTPSSKPSTQTPAPGGGAGQVWVNTASNVYHCQGDRNYGTTKAGQYMSEVDAKAKGARPAYGKACSK